MREVSVPFEVITDLNCGCFLRSSVTIRFCNQEIHCACLLSFSLHAYCHTSDLSIGLFIHSCLFVCVGGSLVSW